MADHFTLLNQPRRPWLDPDDLKKSFHALSATTHPDKHPSADEAAKGLAAKQFAELDWFVEVARVCRDTDAFIAEKARTTSPLLQVQLFPRGQEWIAKLSGLQKEFNQLSESITGELRLVDAQWTRGDPDVRRNLLPKLEELYRLFGYLSRWQSQVQERISRIAF
jgi:hypothetical protein